MSKSDRRVMRLIKAGCMMPHDYIGAHVYRNRVFVIRDNRPRSMLRFLEWLTRDNRSVAIVAAMEITNEELAS